MDEIEFKALIKELKDRGFIEKHRRFCKSALAKYPQGFRGGLGVLYYPEALKFYSKNDICFAVLHEEYHITTQKGHIPYVSEKPANEHAKKQIVLFDNTINLEEFLPELRKHMQEYRESLPKLSKVQLWKFLMIENLKDLVVIVLHKWDCFG